MLELLMSTCWLALLPHLFGKPGEASIRQTSLHQFVLHRVSGHALGIVTRNAANAMACYVSTKDESVMRLSKYIFNFYVSRCIWGVTSDLDDVCSFPRQGRP